jgi:WD40 repeat protein
MLMTDEHALIGNTNGQLQLIEPNTACTMRQMNGRHNEAIKCIAYCPELSRAITGGLDGSTRVWNVATGECVHVLTGHTSSVLCVAVHGTTYVNCTSLIIHRILTPFKKKFSVCHWIVQ